VESEPRSPAANRGAGRRSLTNCSTRQRRPCRAQQLRRWRRRAAQPPAEPVASDTGQGPASRTRTASGHGVGRASR
jgi:hypothetical protein